ncbi:hypothetical protein CHLRE_14g610250v5 [Chlamydomonas reinhardtii]|uniref:Uncharacterized protein n=1 Tax=Chlamydomonas reinhardtii TaxID=3055 RepID=A0A2K3CX71_CHLRE|nr:uncharacterized protein CHLRE_14g610250v5 [Chlamydomonas reinhardtii]PNW72881.1 hypothetical protein CHLRE_14g610250v5 [Chlamydomonas reinhardtii]
MPFMFGKPSSNDDQPLDMYSLSPLSRNTNSLMPAAAVPQHLGDTAPLPSSSRAFAFPRPAASQGLATSAPVPPPGYPALGPHPWAHQQPAPHPPHPAYASAAYTSDATYPVAGGAFPPPPPPVGPPRHSGGASSKPGAAAATATSLLQAAPVTGYPAAGSGAATTAAVALHPHQHPQQWQPAYPAQPHYSTAAGGQSPALPFPATGLAVSAGHPSYPHAPLPSHPAQQHPSSSSSSSSSHGGGRVRLGHSVVHSVGGLARGVLTVGAAGLTAAAARVDKALVRVEQRHERRAARKAAKHMAC